MCENLREKVQIKARGWIEKQKNTCFGFQIRIVALSCILNLLKKKDFQTFAHAVPSL